MLVLAMATMLPPLLLPIRLYAAHCFGLGFATAKTGFDPMALGMICTSRIRKGKLGPAGAAPPPARSATLRPWSWSLLLVCAALHFAGGLLELPADRRLLSPASTNSSSMKL